MLRLRQRSRFSHYNSERRHTTNNPCAGIMRAFNVHMSCIRFNTPAQEAQLDRLKRDKVLAQTAIAQFLSPELTDTKIARLVSMSRDRNHKIRESAALSLHLPEEQRWTLSQDKVESVRICVARNESTPCDILRKMARDKSAQVRSWVAVNFFVPADVMIELENDPSAEVRKLVEWKKSLAEVPK